MIIYYKFNDLSLLLIQNFTYNSFMNIIINCIYSIITKNYQLS